MKNRSESVVHVCTKQNKVLGVVLWVSTKPTIIWLRKVQFSPKQREFVMCTESEWQQSLFTRYSTHWWPMDYFIASTTAHWDKLLPSILTVVFKVSLKVHFATRSENCHGNGMLSQLQDLLLTLLGIKAYAL